MKQGDYPGDLLETLSQRHHGCQYFFLGAAFSGVTLTNHSEAFLFPTP
jgi:hypothetical protein